MTRVMQSQFPRHTLADALKVAHAIWNQYGGDPTPPHDVALAIDSTPTSSVWRLLSGSAKAYGLTDGAYASKSIGLTERGKRIVAPTEEGERERLLREAILQPEIMAKFYRKYDRKNFPRDEIARNVLANLGLPQERTEAALEVLKENGEFVGIFKDTGSNLFVALDEPSVTDDDDQEVEEEEDREAGRANGADPNSQSDEDQPSDDRGSLAERKRQKKRIFIGHGRNHGPLESLKDFLSEFEIPFRVVTEEAHLGRPISTQVREAMQECGSAIIIFTKDEKFFDEDGNEIWRPSENVVHELGAALFAYEGRVVIFKEKGLELPSNYGNIGHIPFEAENFEATTTDLLKELVGFNLVQVTPT